MSRSESRGNDAYEMLSISRNRLTSISADISH